MWVRLTILHSFYPTKVIKIKKLVYEEADHTTDNDNGINTQATAWEEA